ncbi:MAG: hypothetical protein AB1508_00955 [Pseudomonadota bacterium]
MIEICRRLGRAGLAALAFGASGTAFAQSSDDWFAPPPPPASRHHAHWGTARHCSLDQRDYAYINECGELIPGIWDPFPGRG